MAVGQTNEITFEIKGLEELERRLKALPEKIQNKILRPALRKAAEPIQETAIRLARKAPSPTHPKYGHLADNIKTAVTISRSKDSASAIVGTGDAFWGHILEYGHSPLHKAYPFMRPALEQNAQKVLDILVDEIEKGLDKLEI